MDLKKEMYEEWDAIFKQRNEYIKEHPEAKNIPREKTFIDPEGKIRCTKCGATEDISGCIDCVSEKEYLQTKETV